MTLDSLRDHWERFGRSDPLWAVLTDNARDHGAWDVDEFLATGRRDVDRHLAMLADLDVDVPRGRALDFGCGAGRLTQALAESFDRVDGVDIAGSMIEEARALNRKGERCAFHHNPAPDLSVFEDGSFDFVFSILVLQHMEPRLALGYVREFVRVLRPGGIAMFHAPSAPARTAPEALPADAWHAEITVEDPPQRLQAREPVELRVRVRNASPVVWPAGRELGIGAHWRRPDGSFAKISDGRTPLPDSLAPGAEITLPLGVAAPNANGPRTLEVDVSQEWVAWFRERGSEPFRHTVEISGAAAASNTDESQDEPWVAMYCIPRAEVIAFAEAAGGEMVHVLPDPSVGDAFEGYMYVIGRAATPDAHAAVARVSAALAGISDRKDMLPPLDSKRSGRAREAELWLKGKIARATRWATMAQTEHNQTVKAALEEVEAALLVQDQELRRLRAELARRKQDSG